MMWGTHIRCSKNDYPKIVKQLEQKGYHVISVHRGHRNVRITYDRDIRTQITAINILKPGDHSD